MNGTLKVLGMLLLACALGLAIGFAFSDKEAPEPSSGSRPAASDVRVPYHVDGRSERNLISGHEHGEVRTLGLLSESGARQLVSQLDQGALEHRRKAESIAGLPDEGLTLEMLAVQAEALMWEAQLLTARAKVLQGEYTTIRNGTARPLCPDGFQRVCAGLFASVSGEEVEVVVLVPESYPGYAGRIRIYRDLRSAADETYVGNFNNLAYSERRARYQAHLQSQEFLDSGQVKDPKRHQELRNALLRFPVDEAGYTMKLPRSR